MFKLSQVLVTCLNFLDQWILFGVGLLSEAFASLFKNNLKAVSFHWNCQWVD